MFDPRVVHFKIHISNINDNQGIGDCFGWVMQYLDSLGQGSNPNHKLDPWRNGNASDPR